jgi:hypothetical protein
MACGPIHLRISKRCEKANVAIHDKKNIFSFSKKPISSYQG